MPDNVHNNLVLESICDEEQYNKYIREVEEMSEVRNDSKI
jgi:hypothetical protein